MKIYQTISQILVGCAENSKLRLYYIVVAAPQHPPSLQKNKINKQINK